MLHTQLVGRATLGSFGAADPLVTLRTMIAQLESLAARFGGHTNIGDVPAVFWTAADKDAYKTARNALLKELGVSGSQGRDRGIAPSISIGRIGDNLAQARNLLRAVEASRTVAVTLPTTQPSAKTNTSTYVALGIGALVVLGTGIAIARRRG